MSGRFFQRVYDVVRMIPSGKVATYGQIAALLEHPRAARTVGWALHSTPAGVDIPWHRVINSSGYVSTAWVADPPDLQRRLLEAEGVVFDEQGHVDLQRFGWDEWMTPS
jgi:methylated-DNA-protein-cysteine methyltransferase-like protein